MRFAAAGEVRGLAGGAGDDSMKGSFDWRCCVFLDADDAALEAETLERRQNRCGAGWHSDTVASPMIRKPKCGMAAFPRGHAPRH
jgi:hypothetical protein